MREFLRLFLTIWAAVIGAMAGVVVVASGVAALFQWVQDTWGVGACVILAALLITGVASALTAAMPHDGSGPM